MGVYVHYIYPLNIEISFNVESTLKNYFKFKISNP